MSTIKDVRLQIEGLIENIKVEEIKNNPCADELMPSPIAKIVTSDDEAIYQSTTIVTKRGFEHANSPQDMEINLPSNAFTDAALSRLITGDEDFKMYDQMMGYDLFRNRVTNIVSYVIDDILNGMRYIAERSRLSEDCYTYIQKDQRDRIIDRIMNALVYRETLDDDFAKMIKYSITGASQILLYIVDCMGYNLATDAINQCDKMRAEEVQSEVQRIVNVTLNAAINLHHNTIRTLISESLMIRGCISDM